MSRLVEFTGIQGRGPRLTALALASVVFLAGCSETGGFNLKDTFKPKETGGEEVVARASADTTLIEREVEAPDVFQATEAGLWDGRPSLGGVWVAHPDVTDPERVLIRNSSNDKFVVGALFRRERDIPGPQLQISSDAAEALGMLAGAPTQLEVVALRKEAVPIAAPVGDPAQAELLEGAPEVETVSLDPLAGAAAAIEAAPDADAPVNEAAIVTEQTTTSVPARAKTKAELNKPFVQIGIFSVEYNADRTANILRGMGMVPTTKKFDRDGKAFWRLVVGPATTEEERNQLLAQIKKQGYLDAYPVSN